MLRPGAVLLREVEDVAAEVDVARDVDTPAAVGVLTPTSTFTSAFAAM